MEVAGHGGGCEDRFVSRHVLKSCLFAPVVPRHGYTNDSGLAARA